MLPSDLPLLRQWHIKVPTQTVTTSWRAVIPVPLQQAKDISYMLRSEVGVCIGNLKFVLRSLEYTKLYYTIVLFIDDCGDLSIILRVRSFLYILKSITIAACAIFGSYPARMCKG